MRWRSGWVLQCCLEMAYPQSVCVCQEPTESVQVLVGPRVRGKGWESDSGHALQVRQEADMAFQGMNQEPTRDAADDMQYTLACLKVTCTRCPRLHRDDT